jgi:hypothetical protein
LFKIIHFLIVQISFLIILNALQQILAVLYYSIWERWYFCCHFGVGTERYKVTLYLLCWVLPFSWFHLHTLENEEYPTLLLLLSRTLTFSPFLLFSDHARLSLLCFIYYSLFSFFSCLFNALSCSFSWKIYIFLSLQF